MNAALPALKQKGIEERDNSAFAADMAIEKLRRRLEWDEFGADTLAKVREVLGYLPSESSPVLRQAARGLLQAEIDLARIYTAQAVGAYEQAKPSYPLFRGILVTHEGAAGPANRPLGQLAEQYLSQKQSEWAANTALEVRRGVPYAVKLIGAGKPVSAISTDDVRLVRDVLTRLPRNFAQDPALAGKPLIEIAESAPASKPKIVRGTVQKYLSAFKSFLNWCAAEGYLEHVPGETIRAQGAPNPEEARRPFKAIELKQLFGRPQWTGHHSASRRHLPGPS